MKKIILLLLICSTTVSYAQKTNYSGNWEINKTKTDFAGARAAETVVPKTIKVNQQANKLILTRINLGKDKNELPANVETLQFDGTPFERTTADVKVITSLHWINDQSIAISRKGSSTATETWTLEDNGKALVIDRSVEQGDGGKYTIKCYYDKQ